MDDLGHEWIPDDDAEAAHDTPPVTSSTIPASVSGVSVPVAVSAPPNADALIADLMALEEDAFWAIMHQVVVRRRTTHPKPDSESDSRVLCDTLRAVRGDGFLQAIHTAQGHQRADIDKWTPKKPSGVTFLASALSVVLPLDPDTLQPAYSHDVAGTRATKALLLDYVVALARRDPQFGAHVWQELSSRATQHGHAIADTDCVDCRTACVEVGARFGLTMCSARDGTCLAGECTACALPATCAAIQQAALPDASSQRDTDAMLAATVQWATGPAATAANTAGALDGVTRIMDAVASVRAGLRMVPTPAVTLARNALVETCNIVEHHEGRIQIIENVRVTVSKPIGTTVLSANMRTR